MIGKIKLSSGNKDIDVINGTVGEYLAFADTISANTFVEYVKDADSIKIKPTKTRIDGITKTEATTSIVGEIWELATKDQVGLEMVAKYPNNTANYGFTLNDDGYWVSGNKAKGNSYSKCRLKIKTNLPITLKIRSNCYSQYSYDYGIIGNLDQALASSYSEDSSYLAVIKSVDDNINEYTNIDIPGDNIEHFIELKYRKNASTNSNNDYFIFTYDYLIRKED